MLGERLTDRTTGCFQDPGFTVAQKEKCANIIYQPSNTSVLGTNITHVIFAISSYFLLSFFSARITRSSQTNTLPNYQNVNDETALQCAFSFWLEF